MVPCSWEPQPTVSSTLAVSTLFSASSDRASWARQALRKPLGLLQTGILLWSIPRRLAVWPSLSSWSFVLAPMAARDSSSPTIRRVASFVASVCGNRSERPICSMNSPPWPSLNQSKRRAPTPMASSKPRKRFKACFSSQPTAIARAIRSRLNAPARTSSS